MFLAFNHQSIALGPPPPPWLILGIFLVQNLDILLGMPPAQRPQGPSFADSHPTTWRLAPNACMLFQSASPPPHTLLTYRSSPVTMLVLGRLFFLWVPWSGVRTRRWPSLERWRLGCQKKKVHASRELGSGPLRGLLPPAYRQHQATEKNAVLCSPGSWTVPGPGP